MPCAAAELCLSSNLTPKAPDGHQCRGGCGGRLHGICGEVEEEGESKNNRLCPACYSSKQASTAAAGKRKAEDAGLMPKRTKAGGGKKADRSAKRTRLSLEQKMEVLAALGKKCSQETVADNFKCAVRTVQSIKKNRAALETEAALAKGSRKSNRPGDFPEVDAIVLDLFEKARVGKISVGRDVVQAFGRSAKVTLLGAATTSAAVKAKLETFMAGQKWAKNFVKRQNPQSKILHGEAGSVNPELIKEGMRRGGGGRRQEGEEAVFAMGPVIDPRLCVTCSAPTNIAVIKYWGKDSIALNTPINSSASVTLCQDDLRAITTVAASKSFEKDQLWLNGTEEDVSKNKRFQAVIREVRVLATDKTDEATGEVVVASGDWDEYRVRIVSRNTFPTAAGLASSAAGLACLTFSLSKLFNAKETFDGELSAIARQGSGSACRSLYGGFVKWQKGEREDARDSIAIQVADEHHWPEMRALILVVSADKKDTSSTAGMSTSVQTSPLLGFRAKEVVEPRLAEMEKAYLEKDFETFGKLTMQDSNQFHATCLDTYPPIFYMNDVSRSIIRIVHAYNAFHGEVRAAYTFDAGPNAVVYHLAGDSAELLALLLRFYPAPDCADATDESDASPSSSSSSAYVNNEEAVKAAAEADKALPEGLYEACLKTGRTPTAGEVKLIYYTKAGGSPRVLGDEERMLDLESGDPAFLLSNGTS